MITLINEKKFPLWQQRMTHQAITNATKFLSKKYNFDFYKVNCNIKISNTCRFSYYCSDESLIRLQGKIKKWITYKRKGVGVWADCIEIGYELKYTLSLIHEFTHLIQDKEKRKASEIETTKNEIEYVTQFHPYLLKKLKPI